MGMDDLLRCLAGHAAGRPEQFRRPNRERQATVPPEVHEAFQALQRCADGARLGPEMRQVAGELLEETRTWT